MLLHVSLNAFNIFKITHMAQLIDLVIAYGLNGHGLSHGIQIGLGGCNGRDPASRKGNLGGRAELIYHIGIACLFTLT